MTLGTVIYKLGLVVFIVALSLFLLTLIQLSHCEGMVAAYNQPNECDLTLFKALNILDHK